MCPRRDGQAYYAKRCLDGTCNICGGQSLWSQCIHENEAHPFTNTIVENKNFRWEIYQLHDGNEVGRLNC